MIAAAVSVSIQVSRFIVVLLNGKNTDVEAHYDASTCEVVW
jgi:hypothetical protein